MKNLFLSLLSIVFCLSCVGQISENASVTKDIQNYSFDEVGLINNIKTLSSDAFEGRRTGTVGGIKAKEYVIEQFKALDVMPIDDDYIQTFSFKTKIKAYEGTNVLGLIKGQKATDKYIVISAHYDHEGVKDGIIYNGADDDASGTSALFAFAEYLKENPPNHNVILAAFDAEELGLKGAYHFVESNLIPKDKMVLNLNMDMISRSEDNQLFAVGPSLYPKIKPTIVNFQDFGRVDLLIGHEGLDKAQNWTNSSDHAAFHKANIPFIYFGVADHEDYHKPTDDFENIDPEFYKDAVQTVINVFKELDALDL
ncbi:M28 family peptidase [Winogradskyella sp. A3E31]|uniref:M28 family peptidase n=1 Tax=Winogradskyella sp. A3E31 TaxID=3349637 RepID=UPI00398A77AD